jgi:hypothetical protein
MPGYSRKGLGTKSKGKGVLIVTTKSNCAKRSVRLVLAQLVHDRTTGMAAILGHVRLHSWVAENTSMLPFVVTVPPPRRAW